MTDGTYSDSIADTMTFDPLSALNPVKDDARPRPPPIAYEDEDDDGGDEDDAPLTAASVFAEDNGLSAAIAAGDISMFSVQFVHASAEAAHNAAAAAAATNSVTPEPDHIYSDTNGQQLVSKVTVDVDLVDQMLAQEFNALSMAERDRILFEIHGIASDEDPEGVEKHLADMERHLCEIPEKKALEAAKYYDTDYVNKNRLAFLRAERFDAKAAAVKMVKHFESKQLLFGEGTILARAIRYSDLCEGSIKMLESGFMQVLPQRDAAGRSILFVRPELQIKTMLSIGDINSSQEMATKAMWYMLSTTLQDEETQRQGIVAVIVGNPKCLENDITTLKKFHQARESLPKKIVGIHLCSHEISLRPLVEEFDIMTKEMRMHFRPHISNDPKQIIFELQTFGIPITEEYLKPDAQINVAWLREWLDIRKSQEEESKESPAGVIIPRKFDVLFGRGKNNREHTGNLRCSLLVEMHMEQYEKASKYEKTMIAERIVSMVDESLGRFLKYESKKGWVDVPREEAREKVSHFFRFQRSKKVGGGVDGKGNGKASPTAQTQQHTKRGIPPISPELLPAQHPATDRAVKQKSFNEENQAAETE